MQMMKKSPLLALVLLPGVLLLHNYNELFGFIAISQVITYAIIIYSILAVFYLILIRRKVPGSKTALILFCIGLFMMVFTPIHNFFRTITFNSFLGSYWILLPLWSWLLVQLVRKIIKTPAIPPKIVQFLNVLLLCLFATELITFVINSAEVKKTNNLIYPYKPLSTNYSPSKIPDSSKPDIYFLVFDEYTNNQTLKRLWNYDNSQITNWLATNGFYVPTNTRSNYSYTLFSVSSTFNMNYIDAKSGSDATVLKNVLQANKSLRYNEAFSILKQENYSIDFIAPFSRGVQLILAGHQIYMQTLPGSIYSSLKWNFEEGKWAGKNANGTTRNLNEKYDETRQIIEQIKRSADSTVNRKPHFVYGHLMTAHLPHLFDSTGKIMSKEEALNSVPRDTYTSQIGPTNSMMKDIVEYIKLHNKANTIIIIEGDHGFRSFVMGADWLRRTPDSLKRCFFPNFNAVYFPDKDYSRLYERMSPVNIFRIVFDQYFKQNFPLLKDSSIVVKDD